MKKFFYIFFVVLISAIVACQPSIMPKPHGYMRVDYPEKKYSQYCGNLPYCFYMPEYCIMEQENAPDAEKYWTNLTFKNMNAKVYLSFKYVDNNLDTLIEDSHTMAYKHTVKADAIPKTAYINDSAKVYGLMYEIKGNVASPIQFYLTDSVRHFLRGALYFNSIPNKDSLAPAIAFIKQDIEKLFETIVWK